MRFNSLPPLFAILLAVAIEHFGAGFAAPLDGYSSPAATHKVLVKRQTYHYPEELRKYAHTHPGTKIIHGTVGRYAPQEWPAWYTRMIFKWNGESRISPYHPNDVRYLGYEQNRISDNNNLRRVRIV